MELKVLLALWRKDIFPEVSAQMSSGQRAPITNTLERSPEDCPAGDHPARRGSRPQGAATAPVRMAGYGILPPGSMAALGTGARRLFPCFQG